MALMCTILEYLSRPNQRLWSRSSAPDEVASKDTIEALVTVNIFMPVSNALHATSKGNYWEGSKFFHQQSDGFPDWGLGDGVPNMTDLQELHSYD
ncbi:uncharacterized protein RAG0_03000 [Rhynchosporium agropyri]|uniref:Uncharacterized protein n=1 Tax=Rhynchosporium agropyri TaxID=914238 RepID=A0A1E1K375_9HELO|nr:uncharacterized protein RAG0_03000 [Rhynchosporium agropyri]